MTVSGWLLAAATAAVLWLVPLALGAVLLALVLAGLACQFRKPMFATAIAHRRVHHDRSRAP